MSMSLSNSGAAGPGPLLGSVYGENAFEEFVINFQEECLNAFVNKQIFSDDVGAARVYALDVAANSHSGASGYARTIQEGQVEETEERSNRLVELLRGVSDVSERAQGGSTKKVGGVVGAWVRATQAYKQGKTVSEGDVARELGERFGSAASGYGSLFSIDPSTASSRPTSPSAGEKERARFTINHFSAPVCYSTSQFIENDADLLDASYLTLLRTSSTNSFISKLLSGPGVAAERHGGSGEGVVVQSQVTSRSLRGPGIVWGPEVYAAGSLGEAVRRRLVEERGLEGVTEDEVEQRCRAILAEVEQGSNGGDADGEQKASYAHPRLDPSKTYPVLVQTNHVLSEVLSVLGSVVSPVRLSELRAVSSSSSGNPFTLPDLSTLGRSGGAGALEGGNMGSTGTRLFVMSHIRPNDSGMPNSFDKRRLKSQLKGLGLVEVVKRLATSHSASTSSSSNPFGDSTTPGAAPGSGGDWTVSMSALTFCERYVGRMQGEEAERVRQCVRAEGWREGIEYVYFPSCAPQSSLPSSIPNLPSLRSVDGPAARGRKSSISLSLRDAGTLGGRPSVDMQGQGGRMWLTYEAWKGVEDGVRALEKAGAPTTVDNHGQTDYEGSEWDGATSDWHGNNPNTSVNPNSTMLTIPSAYGMGGGIGGESNDNLLVSRTGPDGSRYLDPNGGYGAGGLKSPGMGGEATPPYPGSPSIGPGDDTKEGGGGGGGPPGGDGMVVKEVADGQAVEELPTTRTRRWWLRLVWLCTWLIPSFLLRIIGRMKRPDVRLAWREKVTIFWLIFLFNGIVIFYIVEFGRLLCPDYDKVWMWNEVDKHTGKTDRWVSIAGSVYDITEFIRGDHSNGIGIPSNSPENVEQLVGKDLTYYFPPPLVAACPGLVEEPTLELTRKNTSMVELRIAVHTSGTNYGSGPSERLRRQDWWSSIFIKEMAEFRKGPLVWDKKDILAQAEDENIMRIWGIYEKKVYDFTDYIYTLERNNNAGPYLFLDSDIVDVFRRRAGQDVTENLNKVLAGKDSVTVHNNLNCMANALYLGDLDFRKTPRCQVQNYLLIIASVILMSSMVLKFLAALQLGSKRSPELQDKFVLCQVPCYTEGEDSLRRTIDSLAALNYDDKRKLIFIICDGNIIGSGNDRTTPRIVLDILGVDPGLDVEPLLFKSVGEGSKALNYGKVYSGLYEFEGHVVPYMVVVKVGKPTERSRPGNRGKRDSQILLMHYLNRVHFDAPMSPLEIEIYHQMRNVIGIDPAFYEYIFTIDADTTVTPDSLNRLVAASSDDSAIIGICGETKLTNEQTSWWTMIQVYEYYISHHLSKAFESLFGSVTCLPGCFSLYRIRTADKGRPIIISNRIIEEYAEPNVDTLHKKNLFSLGEDRFLTTLLMKHFPNFKTKFCPDAIAHTMAPESWKVLFSQRRRWINSTVHNLCELVLLPELFGFCCFSMRFFVFIDLLSTIILPATVVYLVYLIIVVSTSAAAFPRIAIIMLGIVYGLQAIIFILKREFMLIGWMVVYIVSYPVYSFFLPVYSFWCMDEFSWGNTRVVVGEGKEKKVLMSEEEKFDESMIPLKKFSEYEAEAWDTGSNKHSDDTGYNSQSRPRSRAPPRSRDHSPHNYQQGSQAGDYYRDTNVTNNSNPNLRLGAGGSQLSHQSHYSQQVPMQTGGFGAPQLPFMPFAGGPGSVTGSDFGGMPPVGMMGYQNTGSVYGMMNAPRNTMMSNMNMFGGGGMMGSAGNSSQQGGIGMTPFANQQRPMSTFSMATSVNPFAGPSMNPNPTDDELFNALRTYLSTQDLMTVTKKTAREAIMAKFPKADLTSKKDFLNQSIDRILSET
ncbi:hypothetical protein H1R20_g7360, partial [Candolleomyces eurysporus]